VRPDQASSIDNEGSLAANQASFATNQAPFLAKATSVDEIAISFLAG
jgi:hypothetical protein